MSDADESLRRLFMPASRARDPSVEVEPRDQTAGGHVYRYGARRVSVVERQERHGHLTHRQGAAARWVYNDYVFGVCGVRDREFATGGGGGAAGYTDAQIDAVSRHRQTKDRLGARLFEVVFAICIDDVTVADFARHRGLNPTAVQELLRCGLDMVADLFSIHD